MKLFFSVLVLGLMANLYAQEGSLKAFKEIEPAFNTGSTLTKDSTELGAFHNPDTLSLPGEGKVGQPVDFNDQSIRDQPLGNSIQGTTPTSIPGDPFPESINEINRFKNGPSDLNGEINGLPNDLLLGEIPSSQGIIPNAVLPEIPKRVIDAEELNMLDSIIGQKNLGRLRAKESNFDGNFKRMSFYEKPTFWDRAYFEGLVGFNPLNGQINQVSPGLGYFLDQNWSAGIGPNLIFNRGEAFPSANLGMRFFLKRELIRERIYLHFENISHHDRPGGNESAFAGTPKKLVNQTMVGGGGFIPLRGALKLNLLILYQVSRSSLAGFEDMPVNIRLGISKTNEP